MLLRCLGLYFVSFSGSLSLLLSELHGGARLNDPHKVGGSATQKFSSATEKAKDSQSGTFHWLIGGSYRGVCVCVSDNFRNASSHLFIKFRSTGGGIMHPPLHHSSALNTTVYMVVRPKHWERPVESSCSNEISGFTITAATCHPSLSNVNAKEQRELYGPMKTRWYRIFMQSSSCCQTWYLNIKR